MSDTQKDLYKKHLGSMGEKRAIEYLKKNGCKILEKNMRTPYGETDILVEEKEDIVFVEVKTRTSDLYGMACEAVDIKKQEKYIKMAKWYMSCKQQELNIRFDVIEVYSKKIEWIKNAF